MIQKEKCSAKGNGGVVDSVIGMEKEKRKETNNKTGNAEKIFGNNLLI